ncbi:hypothetical protein C4Q27_11880 [Pseudomonas sp. SWI36]|nr:hypothetical protein C4Q27_11880 [Pseudomonas sp. SWI36]
MDTIAFGVGVRKMSWPDGYISCSDFMFLALELAVASSTGVPMTTMTERAPYVDALGLNQPPFKR